ncbi:restriction endonuclease subunit S [Streptomyces sp. NPDC003737]|uniref:restriction endonuclease subunit S n=1 Tax=Streptomyces sp. NPDC003737 TaxID=3364685 RepID=UPI003684E3C8
MKHLSEALMLSIDSVTVAPNDRFDIAGVYGFGRGLFTREPIRGSDTSYPRLHRLHAGDVVLSRLKAFEGAIAVIPPHLDGWFLSPEFPTFSIDRDVAEPAYLQHLFRWPGFWELLRGESKGVGARRERVSAQRVLSIKIPLPNRDVQRSIAEKLDGVHDARGHCVGEAERAASFVKELHDAIFRRIQAPQVPVGTVAALQRRPVIVTAGTHYKQIGVRSFGKGIFHKEAVTADELGNKKVFEIHPGELVLSSVFAWEGAIALAGPLEKGMIGSHRFMTYAPIGDQADMGYLRYFFLTEDGLSLIQKASPGAAGRNRTLGIKTFEKTLVPLPPDVEDQRRITKQLDLAYQALISIEQRNNDFDGLYQAALTEAFGASSAA